MHRVREGRRAMAIKFFFWTAYFLFPTVAFTRDSRLVLSLRPSTSSTRLIMMFDCHDLVHMVYHVTHAMWHSHLCLWDIP
jgi:hypothetical protein